MTGHQNEPPPVVGTIDHLLRSIIRVVEVQLGITHPLQSFADSQEIINCPAVGDGIKLLIALSEQIVPHGNYIAGVLKRWLRLTDPLIANDFNVVDMLHDRNILKHLYSRGMAHQYPPQLAVEPMDQELNHIHHLRRLTELNLAGEERKIILLTTHPVHHVTISAGFCIANASYSTTHRLKIITEPNNQLTRRQFLNRGSRSQQQPMRILIINAAGAKNPEFIYTFAETTFECNPHLVIITETRLGGPEGALARNSMNYTASASLEPISFFGGSWFLWNVNALNFECVTMRPHNTTFQVCFPH